MARMRAGRHLLPVLLSAGCVPELPQRETRKSDPATAAPRGPAMLRETMLGRHARARAAVGVSPLRWDRTLAAEALDYARSMAVTRAFRHSEQPEGRGREGENLWTGPRARFTYDEMLDAWTVERRAFVNRPSPGFSRTGRWQDAAHYAQIVWRGTTRVGCALASNRTDDFLVCRYLPPGHMIGKRAF